MKAAALRRTQGWSDEQIDNDLWQPQYQRAGQQMYSLCVDMRGFYLKSGQFLGARGDFMPKPMCETLSRLHDQVKQLQKSGSLLTLQHPSNPGGRCPLLLCTSWYG